MLEKAAPPTFLDDLDKALVASACPCGCASINLTIEGATEPEGGMTGMAGDAPASLPAPESLRPFEPTGAD